MEKIMFIYFAVINIITFAVFGIDKYKAHAGKYRISERTLFALSFAGGAAGGLAGMYLFRHKIRKKAFVIGLPLILIMHAILIKFIFAHL